GWRQGGGLVECRPPEPPGPARAGRYLGEMAPARLGSRPVRTRAVQRLPDERGCPSGRRAVGWARGGRERPSRAPVADWWHWRPTCPGWKLGPRIYPPRAGTGAWVCRAWGTISGSQG